MVLEEYKDIVSTCALVTTMVHMLTGTLICKDIYKKGTSKDFDPMPFLGGIGMCILMLRHAWMLGDPTMININIFGLLTNIAYMAVYYCHSPHTKDTLALITKAMAFIAILLGYAQVEDPQKIEFRWGIIVTLLYFVLLASPFVHLRKIIETKDTSILPFPLIVMGTVVTFLWLLYGLTINNIFLINLVAVVLCIAQLSLFVIFPSKPARTQVPSQEKKKD